MWAAGENWNCSLVPIARSPAASQRSGYASKQESKVLRFEHHALAATAQTDGLMLDRPGDYPPPPIETRHRRLVPVPCWGRAPSTCAPSGVARLLGPSCGRAAPWSPSSGTLATALSTCDPSTSPRPGEVAATLLPPSHRCRAAPRRMALCCGGLRAAVDGGAGCTPPALGIAEFPVLRPAPTAPEAAGYCAVASEGNLQSRPHTPALSTTAGTPPDCSASTTMQGLTTPGQRRHHRPIKDVVNLITGPSGLITAASATSAI